MNFIVWMRLISFLRLFKPTRALIRMLVETLKDMIAFLGVLLAVLVAFFFSYRILNFDSETEKSIFVEEALHVYMITLGFFVTNDYDRSTWVLFYVASVMIPLVMFNMIIAIMTDTYERVTNGMMEADGRELNSLILEQEELMIFTKDKGVASHLHWVQ